MRWDELFGDLAAQWDAEERRGLDAEVADRTRRERAAIGLYERLSAAGPATVGMALVNGVRLSGPVVDVGDGWVLLGEAGGAALVPFGALVAVTGVPSRVGGAGTGRPSGSATPCAG